jgi:hypothetical protein
MAKPEDQKACFHFTNLQPLWAADNLAKGARVFTQHSVRRFDVQTVLIPPSGC